ncbi:MAG: hypothetical protein F4227_10440 [Gammaproteobacteria bacterium]|nr:hypothetical protein [Gammaproteobacteria bacterium]MYF03356.1 hypothetical protein [Gammaproteobacteria bacterium]MYI78263.1 hypothetical protein [Gammaproteobacteria bacterium]
MQKRIAIILLICALGWVIAVGAEAPSEGLSAELRLRYETAEDSVNDDANAYTGRLALKWVVGDGMIRPVVEVEHISAFLGEEYNDGGANRKSQYAVIADPVGTEINQLYVHIGADEPWELLLGRQELAHRSYPWQRYAGTVSWRQNEQTMDAIALRYPFNEKFEFHGAYIMNVNRIFGEDNPNPTRANFELDGLMLTSNVKVQENIDLDLFMFDLAFDEATTLSSQTIGFRVDGTWPTNTDFDFLYSGEFAWQQPDTEMFDDTSYRMLSAGIKTNGHTLKFKNELLSSGNGAAFQTPLATLHIHQGWADRFLSTPAEGVSNTSINASGKLSEVKYTLEFNTYSSDEGGYDFGTEFGAMLSYSWPDESRYFSGWSIGGKFTNFSADTGNIDGTSFNDVTKFWFWFQRKFNLD